MRVRVHAAAIQGFAGATLVLTGTRGRFPRPRNAWADGIDRATVAWAQEHAGGDLTIVSPPNGTNGFQVLPRRWVVERSIAWRGRRRRLSKDDEAMPETSDGMIYAAFGGALLRKLVRQNAL